uniref:SSD domain-containing protein n=1 Tax=Ditylenchus dipsaci TaxID=166011 RepID=A0A915EAN2_9BILA
MSILVFFFIMNVEAILTVVLSILSISLGTVGYLHLLNINLDAVSLISMLLSIGFSVDYSAHICYHFYTFSFNKTKKPLPKSIGHSISTSSTESQTVAIVPALIIKTTKIGGHQTCIRSTKSNSFWCTLLMKLAGL